MILSQNKHIEQVSSRLPFLRNFPFDEFDMQMVEITKIEVPFEDDEMARTEQIASGLIEFTYTKESTTKIAVSVWEKEIEWINSISDKITDLDKILKAINRGIKSKNLLVKRDSVEAAEKWCSFLQDGRSRLSYSTMGEALSRLVKNRQQMVNVINKLTALQNKSGLVSLTKQEHSIVLTYYHFQLIYTKLILGIVIASKISL